MYIFVYGTLKKAYKDLNRSTASFHAGVEWVADASVEGTLYMIDWYPALKMNDTGIVHGEIYRITSPALLHMLDQYEGAITEELYQDTLKKKGHITADYVRKKITIDTYECWIYIFLGTVQQENRITDGIFKLK